MKCRKLTIYFLVAIVFCAANFYSYYQMPEYSTIDDGFVYFGWPFSIYAWLFYTLGYYLDRVNWECLSRFKCQQIS